MLNFKEIQENLEEIKKKLDKLSIIAGEINSEEEECIDVCIYKTLRYPLNQHHQR
jgi:hypothetical protein